MLQRWFDAALEWAGLDHSTEEPLRLVRLTAAVVALAGTCLSLALGCSGAEPRAFALIGPLWAVYGLVAGVATGVLEPALDALVGILGDVGLRRAGGGYSAIEAMIARGELDAAAEGYRERARNPLERTEATIRHAALLAGPLDQPESAVTELDNLRHGPLSPRDEFRVGLALVELYRNRLREPGRAMGELRRLIDRYPGEPATARLRSMLAEMKAVRSEE
ncbi:MAG TPA: hypothetical protein VH763_07470 [Gemmatimonadales bacterium]